MTRMLPNVTVMQIRPRGISEPMTWTKTTFFNSVPRGLNLSFIKDIRDQMTWKKAICLTLCHVDCTFYKRNQQADYLDKDDIF